MTWQCEFFRLGATVLRCRMDAANRHWDSFGCLLGELDYGSEMHLVLKEAGMLPAQRLGALAKRLLFEKAELSHENGKRTGAA
jgi:hypothetical protein